MAANDTFTQYFSKSNPYTNQNNWDNDIKMIFWSMDSLHYDTDEDMVMIRIIYKIQNKGF